MDVFLHLLPERSGRVVLEETPQRTDPAPVQDAEAAVVHAQQVARVGVAVQHAGVQQHGKVRVECHTAQPVAGPAPPPPDVEQSGGGGSQRTLATHCDRRNQRSTLPP